MERNKTLLEYEASVDAIDWECLALTLLVNYSPSQMHGTSFQGPHCTEITFSSESIILEKAQ